MSTNEPPVPPSGPPSEPPTGGYGAPPPPAQPPQPPYGGAPYGGAPYGAPPADPNAWDLGAALSYGWKKFQENAAQLIIAGLIVFVGIGIAYGIGFGVLLALTDPGSVTYDANTNEFVRDDGTGFLVGFIAYAIMIILVVLASLVVGAGLIRGALGITEGKPFQVGEVFKLDNLGPILVTSLLVAAGTGVGYLLCILPGIAFAIASSFSLYFVLDKGLAPVEAIKASFTLVKDNLGNALIWIIVGGIVAGAGAIACGVGVLVTYPLVLIGTAYTYKKLTAQPVAA